MYVCADIAHGTHAAIHLAADQQFCQQDYKVSCIVLCPDLYIADVTRGLGITLELLSLW